MPAKVFAKSFNEVLQEKVIGKAVNKTGEVATSFWLSHFERRLRNQSTQTISMEELLVDVHRQANKLKKELELATQRLAANTAEMGKIARKLTDMSAEKLKYQKQVAYLEEETKRLNVKYGNSESTIQRLHRDVNVYKTDLHVLKQKASEYAKTCEVGARKERQMNALVQRLKQELRLSKGYLDKTKKRLDVSEADLKNERESRLEVESLRDTDNAGSNMDLPEYHEAVTRSVNMKRPTRRVKREYRVEYGYEDDSQDEGLPEGDRLAKAYKAVRKPYKKKKPTSHQRQDQEGQREVTQLSSAHESQQEETEDFIRSSQKSVSVKQSRASNQEGLS